MGQPSPPSPPNAGQNYQQGIQTFLNYLPRMLSAEYTQRSNYDPKYIQQQQGFQSRFGPTQYNQQLQALGQLDPYGVAVRNALGQNIMGQLGPNNEWTNDANAIQRRTMGDLSYGTHLDPAFQQQLQSEIRGAQAARGNTQGNAGISGETLYQGRAGQDLYNQRLSRAEQAGQYAAGQRQIPLSNAGQFLSTTSPIQQIQGIQPVQAPDAFRLVNPNAGYLGQQIGQQGYQNQLAAYSQNAGQGSGWGSLAGGVIGGAVGGYFGGPAGAQAGGAGGSALGGYAGGYFSDEKTKENIKEVGVSPKGHKEIEFNYKWDKVHRFHGVSAQEAQKIAPDAVHDFHGVLWVDYRHPDIDVQFRSA